MAPTLCGRRPGDVLGPRALCGLQEAGPRPLMLLPGCPLCTGGAAAPRAGHQPAQAHGRCAPGWTHWLWVDGWMRTAPTRRPSPASCATPVLAHLCSRPRCRAASRALTCAMRSCWCAHDSLRSLRRSATQRVDQGLRALSGRRGSLPSPHPHLMVCSTPSCCARCSRASAWACRCWIRSATASSSPDHCPQQPSMLPRSPRDTKGPTFQCVRVPSRPRHRVQSNESAEIGGRAWRLRLQGPHPPGRQQARRGHGLSAHLPKAHCPGAPHRPLSQRHLPAWAG